MKDKDHIKEELEEQLETVKQRLQILDMIEGKLIQMRELAQTVLDEELTNIEIQEINTKIDFLREQVRLLYSESIQRS